jgi:hypothetical protein
MMALVNPSRCVMIYPGGGRVVLMRKIAWFIDLLELMW